jgi:hypothetical protein
MNKLNAVSRKTIMGALLMAFPNIANFRFGMVLQLLIKSLQN